MINYFNALVLLIAFQNTEAIKMYNFSTETNANEWRIVNDDVMGGISKSLLSITNEGFGNFSGRVSLAYNGGFASIQLDKSMKLSTDKKFVVLHIKGDKKNYEFRIKSDVYQYQSYVQTFSTTGDWEIVKLRISDFYPQFRGRKLNMSNFNFQNIEQCSFLIANKKEENFALLIDWIGVE